MATIADIIAAARVELDDAGKTRWTDEACLTLLKKCIRRANDILILRGISFALSRVDFNTAADTAEYDQLPATYSGAYGLYRTDLNRRLDEIDHDTFERIPSISSMQVWRVTYDQKIEIKGTPTQVVAMRLYYWPTLDVSAYETGTDTPWSGRLDDVLEEYLTLRCKNIDEMEVSFDQMLQQEIEENRLGKYEMFSSHSGGVQGYLS